MRGEELLYKMSLAEPEFVEAAERRPVKRKAKWISWGAAAACICIALFGAMVFGGRENTALQPISIPEYETGGMGFEGYMVYDPSELENGSPWTADAELETLPVYKNLAYDPSGAGVPKGLSEDEMRKKLHETADALGLEIVSEEVITDGYELVEGKTVPSDVPTRIEAETALGTLSVWANAHIRLDFGLEDGIELPDEYSFTYSGTSDAEAEAVLGYLAERYAAAFGYENTAAVSWADRDIYGEQNRRYNLYEYSGDPVEDILNFNLRKIGFSPNEEGELWLIGADDALSVAEKIGDYPIVGLEEATQRLVEGYYSTSVPFAMPGEEYIARVELMYRSGPLEEILLPYYRFYVLLPDTDGWIMERENGLKTYGAYYVPAIADEYITDMPVYDGHFN